MIQQAENLVDEPAKPCPIGPGLSRALLMQLESARYDPKGDALAGVDIAVSKNLKADFVTKDFIDKYKIKLLGELQIAVTLPEGVSRFQFLLEAQRISLEFFNRRPISPYQLILWENSSLFYKKLSHPLEIMAEFDNKFTRLPLDELEGRGWLDLPSEDLAVAHTAYFMAKGGNISQWYLLLSSTRYLLYEGGDLVVPGPLTVWGMSRERLATRSLTK